MLSRSSHTTLRWATTGIAKAKIVQRQQTFSSIARLCQDAIVPRWHARRLSKFWLPTGAVTSSSDGKQDEATALLIKAGFIRQAHSGIYHYLPLAEGLERSLARKLEWHLETLLGASQVSLSALSSEDLWRRSGRIDSKPLDEVDHQFLAVKDRKDSHLILSPTHEEEITTLVANNAKSYKEFPLRLFQIGRKYRDELRPRMGLLRTKEFLMKDMYTFDTSEEAAIKTYDQVREVYRTFFKRLGVPVVEARASSGDMGGELSHEFHILSEHGEDTIHICQECGFAENEEVTSKPAKTPIEEHSCPQCAKTTMTKHNAIEVGHTFHLGTRYSEPLNAIVEVPTTPQKRIASSGETADLPTREVAKTQRIPLQMGCHGIGVSRLIGATASLFADSKGINWPLNFFHRGVLIIVDGDGSNTPGLNNIFLAVTSAWRKEGRVLRYQTSVDDRNKTLGWKLKDAELIGYPLVIVLGRSWVEEGIYEVKCRANPEIDSKSPRLMDAVLKALEALDPEGNKVDDSKERMWRVTNLASKLEQEAAHERVQWVQEHRPDIEVKALPSRQYEVRALLPSRGLLLTKDGKETAFRRLNMRALSNPLLEEMTETSASSRMQGTRANDSWIPSSPKSQTQERSRVSRPAHDGVRKEKTLAMRRNFQKTAPDQADPALASMPSQSPKPVALSREHLLEKVQLLERMFALQDKEKEDKAKERK